MKGRTIKLKKGIRKGTIIKDLYDDGVFYYKIGNTWYPTDFNDFKHSDFCEEITNQQTI